MNTQKSALFTRDFALVVIGQIISLFGNAILHFALPLYLLRETGSIPLFGAVNACSFLPMILMGPIGKVSFGAEKLSENFNALMGAIIKAKPAAAKGQYIKSCTVASTMGPGVKINGAKLV